MYGEHRQPARADVSFSGFPCGQLLLRMGEVPSPRPELIEPIRGRRGSVAPVVRLECLVGVVEDDVGIVQSNRYPFLPPNDHRIRSNGSLVFVAQELGTIFVAVNLALGTAKPATSDPGVPVCGLH